MPPDKDDLEYVYFLKELLAGGTFDGAAVGIAKQAIHKGPHSLTASQAAALEIAIRQLASRKCESCHNTIPWTEMYQAIDSGRCLACIPR